MGNGGGARNMKSMRAPLATNFNELILQGQEGANGPLDFPDAQHNLYIFRLNAPVLPRFVNTSVMQLYHPDLPASDTLQYQQNLVKLCRIRINCSIINFVDHIGMCIDNSAQVSTCKNLLSRNTNNVFLI